MDVHNLCSAVLQAGSATRVALRGLLVLILMGPMVAACSSVPDAYNPVEWVDSVDDYLSGDDEEPDPEQAARVEAERAQGVPGAEEEFPSLSSVPDEAPTVTSYEARGEISEGLVADAAGARYSDNPAEGSMVTTNTEWSQPVETSTVVTSAPPTVSAEPTVSATTTVTAEPTVTAAPTVSATAEPPAPQTVTTPAVAVSPPPPPPPVATSVAEPAMTVSPPPEPISPSPAPVAAVSPPPAPARAEPPRQSVQAEPPRQYAAEAITSSTHVAVIYYAYGSKRLSDSDRAVLAQVAAQQRANGAVVRVVGHASTRVDSDDPVKTKIANFSIAYDRAQVVASELIRLGVPANRVHVVSASDTQPAYSEATKRGEAANRRADIYLDIYGRSG
jgi:outer membrane protein OmpA-like peptidoglycan-associated protein